MKCNRPLYGLKDTARTWKEKMFDEFEKAGLQELQSLPCVFQKSDFTAVCHVDDLIIFEANRVVLNEFQKNLKSSENYRPENTHPFLG